MEGKKGITLIALVITIIVIVVIAGTAISLTLNEDGLFEKTNVAVEKYNDKVSQQNRILDDYLTKYDEFNTENDENSEDILEIEDGLILRRSGKLTAIGAPELTNGESVVINDTNLDEILIANNVKRLFDNQYFLTDDNKLYNESLDYLIASNINCIIELQSYTGNIYYIDTNNVLRHLNVYTDEMDVISENVNNAGITRHKDSILYIKDNNKLYIYSDEILSGAGSITTGTKYYSNGSQNLDDIYLFYNGAWGLKNNGTLVNILDRTQEIADATILGGVASGPVSYSYDTGGYGTAVGCRFALDNTGNLYLLSCNSITNLTNQSSSVFYQKIIKKVFLTPGAAYYNFVMIDDDGHAYVGIIQDSNGQISLATEGYVESINNKKIISAFQRENDTATYYQLQNIDIGSILFITEDNNSYIYNYNTGNYSAHSILSDVIEYVNGFAYNYSSTNFARDRQSVLDYVNGNNYLYKANGTGTDRECESSYFMAGRIYSTFIKQGNEWFYSTEEMSEQPGIVM